MRKIPKSLEFDQIKVGDKIMQEILIKDKDINKFIKDAIKGSKDQANEIKEFYDNNENKNNLKSNLMTNRLFECLADYAKIKITEKSTDELRENKNEKQ